MHHISAFSWLGILVAALSGFVVGGLFGGVVTTAFFIWRKDLLAMMIFHAITDAMGFLITPMFSEWWTQPDFR